MSTKFLNLDEIKSDVGIVFKLNDVEHEMVELTLEDFLTNMKEIEDLSLTATPREEVEQTIRMIRRSFPTLEEAELRRLRLSQLRAVQDWMRGVSGQDVEKVEPVKETEEGNPQTAS